MHAFNTTRPESGRRMAFEKLSFPNPDGLTLGARLDLPQNGTPRAYALFAHCFTCTKNLRAVGNIAGALTDRGIAVLRFDFTGLGESEGDFADTNFTTNVADLVAAAEYLGAEYESPQLLIGHSLGGAAVLQAAGGIPSVRAVATIGAPSDPGHVLNMLEGRREEIERDGEAEVMLAGRPFTIRKQFLDDLESGGMDGRIRDLKRALLVCHGPFDNTVGIDNAQHIFVTAKHPKSFVSLDRADHLMSNEEDSRYAGRIIAEWAGRYLAEPPAAASLESPTDGDLVVHTGPKGYRTEIRVDGHHLIADEPEDVGGTDLGPSPYDLLNASLGSCTSMTLRMYAGRKEWPLDGIEVRLRHEKVHAEDCEKCETETGKVDRIVRTIRLEGNLTDEQRSRLLEIADRCPVHRTLHSEIEVLTHLAE